MQFKHTVETWPGVDNRWLGSADGTESVQSCMLDMTNGNWNSGVHYPLGWLKSGIPLIKVSGSEGRYRPWVAAVDWAGPPTDRADGFLLWGGQKFDVTSTEVAAEIIMVGFVRLPYLPVVMTAAQIPAQFTSVYAQG
jgi:hypothetical protein